MDVVVVENPWRCLCLGFRLQVTYRRFLRFTTRQSLHKRRTADLTRILLKLFAMLDGLIRRGQVGSDVFRTLNTRQGGVQGFTCCRCCR